MNITHISCLVPQEYLIDQVVVTINSWVFKSLAEGESTGAQDRSRLSVLCSDISQ